MTTIDADVATYANIEVQQRGGYTILTINRPQVLNALSVATLQELHRAVQSSADARTTRAIIITGVGRAFAAGADINELHALHSAHQGLEYSRLGHRLLSTLERLEVPVIMAVNGHALGGGCELAMAGDIILAADTARFGQPEINLGLIPGFGGTQRLPRLVGRVKALELILLGEPITAQEAHRIGLVNRVVPAASLMPAAEEVASALATKAPLAVALAKRALYDGLEVGPRAGNEAEAAFFGLIVDTEDRLEGTRAFLEKRPPSWRGE